jgi:hypothetical protein
MISSIQQILQKHHKWIFGVLLGIIIIAFVFTIGAAPGIVGKRRSAIFYGKNLLSKREMRPVVNAVSISSMAGGIQLYSERQLERAVLTRCALLAQVNELSIPRVDDGGLVKFMGTLPGFLDENGDFSDGKYRTFLDVCKRNGIGEPEIREALLDDQRIDALVRAVAGDGVAFAYQVERALAALYTEYDLAIAKLSYDSFHPQITVTEEDLQRHYGENLEGYRVPEMVAVSVVRFESARFAGDVPVPGEEVLRGYFQAEREKFGPEADFESARSDVAEKYVGLEARKRAMQMADEFAGALYGGDVELNSDEWHGLLSKFGVKKEKVAAYSKLKLPSVDGIPEAALIEVCDMDSARYYSDPFVADFGAAVLIVEGRRASRILPFAKARARVESDVRGAARRAQFADMAERLRVSLSDATRADVSKRFAEFGLVPEFFTKISLSNSGEKLANVYWDAIWDMGKDECVCRVEMVDDVAFLVVLERNPPDYATVPAVNRGDIENRLREFDRDFCLAEYVDWLIGRGLKKIK